MLKKVVMLLLAITCCVLLVSSVSGQEPYIDNNTTTLDDDLGVHIHEIQVYDPSIKGSGISIKNPSNLSEIHKHYLEIHNQYRDI